MARGSADADVDAKLIRRGLPLVAWGYGDAVVEAHVACFVVEIGRASMSLSRFQLKLEATACLLRLSPNSVYI